jgi:acyl-coenzyme A synthetase/AMP-(fatty) acid ligase
VAIVPLSDLLAGARAERHCVAIQDGRPVTLARLRADVAHNADRLASGAIRRAAVVCDHGYWFVVGVLALAKIGSEVIVPLNSQPGTLQSVANQVDALLIDSDTITVGRNTLLETGPVAVPPFHSRIGEGRIFFFTSGSTGEVKRVEKSLAQFEREAATLESLWGADLEQVPVIGTVTHQHVFGMTFRIMWPLVSGRPFHSEFHIAWEPLKARLNGPSMIVTSPAQLTRLGGLTPEPEVNRPRMIISAGAPLPAEAANEANAIFGCNPTEIFGSTEAGVIGWRHGGKGPVLWRAFPSVEVMANAEGVLMLRSLHASGEGWNAQSDRISFVEDGRFRLEGRIDRVVKIEGKRVSLQRLERELAALPWVTEAAVVVLGGDRAYLGAAVRLSPAGVAELDRLGKFRFERTLRRELSATHDLAVLPRRWRFVDLMPIDGLGKRRVADVAALLEQST